MKKKKVVGQISEFNKGNNKKRNVRYFLGGAAIVMISICLCMPPVNSYAANILGHVQMILLKHDGSPKKAGDVNGNIGMADMTEDARQVSSMDNQTEEDRPESNDLVFRTMNDPGISLAKGQKIMLEVENGEEYEDVSISWKDNVRKIGTLNARKPFLFEAADSGEYIVLAGKDQVNITREITVGYVTECEYDGGSKSNGMLPVRKQVIVCQMYLK